MRNIALFSALVIILFLPFPVFADDNTGNETKTAYAFSLTPNFGFLWGQGEEIVFHDESPPRNDSKYMSQLLWDFKPLLYLGLDMDYSPQNHFVHNGFDFSLSIKYGLPLSTGIMEDRDWLDRKENFLTHYSRHDAFSRSSLSDLFEGYGTFITNFSFGYSWALGKGFWLKAFGELSFLRFSWKSFDGYIQYGPNYYLNPDFDDLYPWDPSFEKKINSGPAINYSQNWIIFAPGISVGYRINNYFTVSAFAALTPFIYGAHRDDHLLIKKIFLDFLYGGLSVRAGSELQFSLNEKFSFTLSVSIMNLSGARGDNYMSTNGGPYSTHPNIAGGGFSFMNCALSATYVF